MHHHEPRMSHPSISFRQEFIDLHPASWQRWSASLLLQTSPDLAFPEDFIGRIQKLKVNLAAEHDYTVDLTVDDQSVVLIFAFPCISLLLFAFLCISTILNAAFYFLSSIVKMLDDILGE